MFSPTTFGSFQILDTIRDRDVAALRLPVGLLGLSATYTGSTSTTCSSNNTTLDSDVSYLGATTRTDSGTINTTGSKDRTIQNNDISTITGTTVIPSVSTTDSSCASIRCCVKRTGTLDSDRLVLSYKNTRVTIEEASDLIRGAFCQDNGRIITCDTGMITTGPCFIPVDIDIAQRNRCIICHSEDYIVLQRTGQRCAIRNNIISGNRRQIYRLPPCTGDSRNDST